MQKEIKIAQVSFPQTGSTILCNVLYGFFCPALPITFRDADLDLPKDKLVYKSLIYSNSTIGLNLLNNDIYNIFIIMSEREKKYPEKLQKHPKVLIFPFQDLIAKDLYNPNSQRSLEWVILNIYEKSTNFLPPELFTNKDKMIKNATERVAGMNRLYEEIKDKPFKYYDKFYHIHGSHRGGPRR